MFSTKTYAKATLTAIALLASTAALANALVIRATGPSASAYPTGKSFPPDARIALKAGDAVTVLDGKGTRVLKGPGMVPVAGTGQAANASIAQLISNTGARQTRTGATRGVVGGGPARSPNVWYVDASRSGATCVVDAANVTVWRPADAAAATLNLTRLSDGKSARLDFRAGQSTRAWPTTDLPINDGASYRVAGANAKTATEVKFILIGQVPASLDGTAEALLSKGCATQVNLLADATVQDGAVKAN